MILSTSIETSLVEHRVGIARQLAPRLDRLLPHLALRRIGTPAQIFERLLVRRDHAHLGAEFDREIADGEPALDRQIADGAAGIFDRVAGAAGGADMTDQREDHVLAVTPSGSLPSNLTRMVFGRRWISACVASTCVNSLEPMPKASAPSPPWVQVWLSPQTIRQPGRLRPSSGR